MFNFGQEIGIDLGTATVLVYVRGKGIKLREPSVIAMVRDTGEVKAVGDEAYQMLGRTPGNIVAVKPMRDGVIADYELTEKMLKAFVRKVLGANTWGPFRPSIMVCVPSGVTEVEKRAVLQATREVGARRAFLIEEPLAAAIGAGVNIAEPTGSMIVDIGGGTTDVAIISLGGIVVSESLRIAGNEFDEAIIRYVRNKENLLIGERTAEEVKMKIGAAVIRNPEDGRELEIRGRDLINGLPKSVTLTSEDVVEALKEPLQKIADGGAARPRAVPPRTRLGRDRPGHHHDRGRLAAGQLRRVAAPDYRHPRRCRRKRPRERGAGHRAGARDGAGAARGANFGQVFETINTISREREVQFGVCVKN